MKIPSIGRIVHLTLSEAQVAAINDARARSEGRLCGNSVRAGDVFPMMITRVWTLDTPATPESVVQGQVFLDGNDTFWATSVHVNEAPSNGNAHWPPHVG